MPTNMYVNSNLGVSQMYPSNSYVETVPATFMVPGADVNGSFGNFVNLAPVSPNALYMANAFANTQISNAPWLSAPPQSLNNNNPCTGADFEFCSSPNPTGNHPYQAITYWTLPNQSGGMMNNTVVTFNKMGPLFKMIDQNQDNEISTWYARCWTTDGNGNEINVYTMSNQFSDTWGGFIQGNYSMENGNGSPFLLFQVSASPNFNNNYDIITEGTILLNTIGDSATPYISQQWLTMHNPWIQLNVTPTINWCWAVAFFNVWEQGSGNIVLGGVQPQVSTPWSTSNSNGAPLEIISTPLNGIFLSGSNNECNFVANVSWWFLPQGSSSYGTTAPFSQSQVPNVSQLYQYYCSTSVSSSAIQSFIDNQSASYGGSAGEQKIIYPVQSGIFSPWNTSPYTMVYENHIESISYSTEYNINMANAEFVGGATNPSATGMKVTDIMGAGVNIPISEITSSSIPTSPNSTQITLSNSLSQLSTDSSGTMLCLYSTSIPIGLISWYDGSDLQMIEISGYTLGAGTIGGGPYLLNCSTETQWFEPALTINGESFTTYLNGNNLSRWYWVQSWDGDSQWIEMGSSAWNTITTENNAAGYDTISLGYTMSTPGDYHEVIREITWEQGKQTLVAYPNVQVSLGELGVTGISKDSSWWIVFSLTMCPAFQQCYNPSGNTIPNSSTGNDYAYGLPILITAIPWSNTVTFEGTNGTTTWTIDSTTNNALQTQAYWIIGGDGGSNNTITTDVSFFLGSPLGSSIGLVQTITWNVVSAASSQILTANINYNDGSLAVSPTTYVSGSSTMEIQITLPTEQTTGLPVNGYSGLNGTGYYLNSNVYIVDSSGNQHSLESLGITFSGNNNGVCTTNPFTLNGDYSYVTWSDGINGSPYQVNLSQLSTQAQSISINNTPVRNNAISGGSGYFTIEYGGNPFSGADSTSPAINNLPSEVWYASMVPGYSNNGSPYGTANSASALPFGNSLSLASGTVNVNVTSQVNNSATFYSSGTVESSEPYSSITSGPVFDAPVESLGYTWNVIATTTANPWTATNYLDINSSSPSSSSNKFGLATPLSGLTISGEVGNFNVTSPNLKYYNYNNENISSVIESYPNPTVVDVTSNYTLSSPVASGDYRTDYNITLQAFGSMETNFYPGTLYCAFGVQYNSQWYWYSMSNTNSTNSSVTGYDGHTQYNDIISSWTSSTTSSPIVCTFNTTEFVANVTGATLNPTNEPQAAIDMIGTNLPQKIQVCTQYGWGNTGGPWNSGVIIPGVKTVNNNLTANNLYVTGGISCQEAQPYISYVNLSFYLQNPQTYENTASYSLNYVVNPTCTQIDINDIKIGTQALAWYCIPGGSNLYDYIGYDLCVDVGASAGVGDITNTSIGNVLCEFIPYSLPTLNVSQSAGSTSAEFSCTPYSEFKSNNVGCSFNIYYSVAYTTTIGLTSVSEMLNSNNTTFIFSNLSGATGNQYFIESNGSTTINLSSVISGYSMSTTYGVWIGSYYQDASSGTVGPTTWYYCGSYSSLSAPTLTNVGAIANPNCSGYINPQLAYTVQGNSGYIVGTDFSLYYNVGNNSINPEISNINYTNSGTTTNINMSFPLSTSSGGNSISPIYPNTLPGSSYTSNSYNDLAQGYFSITACPTSDTSLTSTSTSNYIMPLAPYKNVNSDFSWVNSSNVNTIDGVWYGGGALQIQFTSDNTPNAQNSITSNPPDRVVYYTNPSNINQASTISSYSGTLSTCSSSTKLDYTSPFLIQNNDVTSLGQAVGIKPGVPTDFAYAYLQCPTTVYIGSSQSATNIDYTYAYTYYGKNYVFTAQDNIVNNSTISPSNAQIMSQYNSSSYPAYVQNQQIVTNSSCSYPCGTTYNMNYAIGVYHPQGKGSNIVTWVELNVSNSSNSTVFNPTITQTNISSTMISNGNNNYITNYNPTQTMELALNNSNWTTFNDSGYYSIEAVIDDPYTPQMGSNYGYMTNYMGPYCTASPNANGAQAGYNNVTALLFDGKGPIIISNPSVTPVNGVICAREFSIDINVNSSNGSYYISNNATDSITVTLGGTTVYSNSSINGNTQFNQTVNIDVTKINNVTYGETMNLVVTYVTYIDPNNVPNGVYTVTATWDTQVQLLEFPSVTSSLTQSPINRGWDYVRNYPSTPSGTNVMYNYTFETPAQTIETKDDITIQSFVEENSSSTWVSWYNSEKVSFNSTGGSIAVPEASPSFTWIYNPITPPRAAIALMEGDLEVKYTQPLNNWVDPAIGCVVHVTPASYLGNMTPWTPNTNLKISSNWASECMTKTGTYYGDFLDVGALIQVFIPFTYPTSFEGSGYSSSLSVYAINSTGTKTLIDTVTITDVSGHYYGTFHFWSQEQAENYTFEVVYTSMISSSYPNGLYTQTQKGDYTMYVPNKNFVDYNPTILNYSYGIITKEGFIGINDLSDYEINPSTSASCKITGKVAFNPVNNSNKIPQDNGNYLTVNMDVWYEPTNGLQGENLFIIKNSTQQWTEKITSTQIDTVLPINLPTGQSMNNILNSNIYLNGFSWKDGSNIMVSTSFPYDGTATISVGNNDIPVGIYGFCSGATLDINSVKISDGIYYITSTMDVTFKNIREVYCSTYDSTGCNAENVLTLYGKDTSTGIMYELYTTTIPTTSDNFNIPVKDIACNKLPKYKNISLITKVFYMNEMGQAPSLNNSQCCITTNTGITIQYTPIESTMNLIYPSSNITFSHNIPVVIQNIPLKGGYSILDFQLQVLNSSGTCLGTFSYTGKHGTLLGNVKGDTVEERTKDLINFTHSNKTMMVIMDNLNLISGQSYTITLNLVIDPGDSIHYNMSVLSVFISNTVPELEPGNYVEVYKSAINQINNNALAYNTEANVSTASNEGEFVTYENMYGYIQTGFNNWLKAMGIMDEKYYMKIPSTFFIDASTSEYVIDKLKNL